MFVRIGIASSTLLLLTATGCPTAPGNSLPDIGEFMIPNDATYARIDAGENIVYVIADENGRDFDLYRAEPGQAVDEHELIGSIDAAAVGFGATDDLTQARTISLADNLEIGVIGFESGSYVIEPAQVATAQLIGDFTATPLTFLGDPVFDPAINPFGNRLAFRTSAGQVGVGGFNGGLVNPSLLGQGINPIFGFDNRLGFTDPTYSNFFAYDFNNSTFDTFGLTGLDYLSDPTFFPYSSFEAGLTPGGINNVGTFIDTNPFDAGSRI